MKFAPPERARQNSCEHAASLPIFGNSKEFPIMQRRHFTPLSARGRQQGDEFGASSALCARHQGGTEICARLKVKGVNFKNETHEQYRQWAQERAAEVEEASNEFHGHSPGYFRPHSSSSVTPHHLSGEGRPYESEKEAVFSDPRDGGQAAYKRKGLGPLGEQKSGWVGSRKGPGAYRPRCSDPVTSRHLKPGLDRINDYDQKKHGIIHREQATALQDEMAQDPVVAGCRIGSVDKANVFAWNSKPVPETVEYRWGVASPKYEGPLVCNSTKKPGANGQCLIDLGDRKRRSYLVGRSMHEGMIGPRWR